MTKESAAWLAIRLLGLLLLGQALYLLFSSAVHLFGLHRLYGIDGALASDAERLIIRSWVDAGIALAEALVIGGLALYFLRRGKAVHAMLMRETT